MEYYDKYYEGVFWLPGKEENRIIATLHIDKEGVAIISSLLPLRKDEQTARAWPEFDVVFGYINSHDESKTFSIKLYDTFKVLHSSGALNKYKYKSYNVFLSASFDRSITGLSYNSIMLHSEIINDWIDITGFKSESKIPDYENFTVSQSYEQPKQMDLFQNEDFLIYVYFRANTGYSASRKTYIEEMVFINIDTTKNHDIKELFEIKSVIEQLLNIVLFTPFYSERVELRSTSEKTYRSLAKPKKLERNLANKIRFEAFRQNSQNIFSAWLEKQKELDLAIRNFFSAYGQPGVLIENKFLTYVSVIENYHKNRIKKKDILTNRLQHIFGKSGLSDDIKDIAGYVERIIKTRNYHTHLEEKHKEKSFSDDEIKDANLILEYLIRELFLKELEVEINFDKDIMLKRTIARINH